MTTRPKLPKKAESFDAGVGRGLRRVGRTPLVRRMQGMTCVWENGKVVARDSNTQDGMKLKNSVRNLPECRGCSGRFMQNQLRVTARVT
jgi:hypothetical protein